MNLSRKRRKTIMRLIAACLLVALTIAYPMSYELLILAVILVERSLMKE
jgi:hypothetical protein